MGLIYTAQFSAVGATVAQDLFEILAAASGVIIVHDWNIFQTSDVGDAAEEIMRLECVRGIGAVATGTGGAVVTAQPVMDGAPAFGGTVKANNTTRMAVGTGTLETLPQHGWNVRSEYQKIYVPETRPVISPGNRWTLSLPIAPLDALTMGGTVTFEVVGG